MEEKAVKTLSDYERGFIEGVIDGEGSISLYKYKRKDRKRGWGFDIRVQIGNTNKRLLEKVKEACDGGSVYEAGITSAGKTFYMYLMPRSLIRNIFPQLELVVKEEQRILLLEALYLLKKHSSYHTPYNEQLGQIAEDMKELNK